jgi:hypothetical protein
VGGSTLRKRGKIIADSLVQDPDYDAQMKSLDHRGYMEGLWEKIGSYSSSFYCGRAAAPAKSEVMMARNVWHGVR